MGVGDGEGVAEGDSLPLSSSSSELEDELEVLASSALPGEESA